MRSPSPDVAHPMLKVCASTVNVGLPMTNARRSKSDVGSSTSDECPPIADVRRSMTI